MFSRVCRDFVVVRGPPSDGSGAVDRSAAGFARERLPPVRFAAAVEPRLDAFRDGCDDVRRRCLDFFFDTREPRALFHFFRIVRASVQHVSACTENWQGKLSTVRVPRASAVVPTITADVGQQPRYCPAEAAP